MTVHEVTLHCARAVHKLYIVSTDPESSFVRKLLASSLLSLLYARDASCASFTRDGMDGCGSSRRLFQDRF